MSTFPGLTARHPENLPRLLARLSEMQAEAERQMIDLERCGLHVASSYWRGRMHSVRAVLAMLHESAEAEGDNPPLGVNDSLP